MHKQILHYLKRQPARELLWVADSAPPGGISARHLPPSPQLRASLEGAQFDFAVLQDLPGPMDKAGAEALVAQLRDISARRILWLLDRDAAWSRNELLALGFRLLDQASEQRLYGYDIDNYKTTPDWLSPRHWANPELWNKFRW